jgi:hypothetical protein
MNRVQIIHHFISKNNYNSYLEIGTQKDKTFNAINIKTKVGVDPERGGTHRMSSDMFFAQNKEKFDIIFIDGLHHSEQVLKDINNSLACLNKGGTIVVHDCLPVNEDMQKVPRIVKAWTGDCWLSFVYCRQTKGNLKMYTIETDMGCGIIQRGRQTKLVIEGEVDFKGFEKNKKEWLNLISVDEFLKL